MRFHVWICPPHLPAFSACLTFDLMKHHFQSRGMEKGRGGMESVRGKRRRGGGEKESGGRDEGRGAGFRVREKGVQRRDPIRRIVCRSV